MSTGERIRSERKKKGWSQAQLATRLKALNGSTTQGLVSSWERGAEPRPDSLSEIAEVLGVPIADLLDTPDVRDELLRLQRRVAELEAWREAREGPARAMEAVADELPRPDRKP